LGGWGLGAGGWGLVGLWGRFGWETGQLRDLVPAAAVAGSTACIESTGTTRQAPAAPFPPLSSSPHAAPPPRAHPPVPHADRQAQPCDVAAVRAAPPGDGGPARLDSWPGRHHGPRGARQHALLQVGAVGGDWKCGGGWGAAPRSGCSSGRQAGRCCCRPRCPPGPAHRLPPAPARCPRSIYEGLRRVLPGRPPSGESHRGLLQLLKDASSAVLCGGLAGGWPACMLTC
jgi:hypothetical protein